MRKINQKGIDLIKKFEGFKPRAYYDIAGVLTIGYGHTSKTLTPLSEITEEEAEELLRKDIATAELFVNSYVKVDINDNMFSALSSFTFNLGPNSLRISTLLKLLNSQAPKEDVANEFLKWCKVFNPRTGAKQESVGLLNRRKAERELFLEPA